MIRPLTSRASLGALLQIGGQDGYTLELLHLLQQIRYFDIRIAVMGVPHFGAFAEQRVGLVKKEYCVGACRSGNRGAIAAASGGPGPQEKAKRVSIRRAAAHYPSPKLGILTYKREITANPVLLG